MLAVNAYSSSPELPLQLLDRYGLEGKKAFAVLSKAEVQHDISLSSNQLTRIKAIRNLDAKAMPAVSNFLKKTGPATNVSQRLQRSEEVIKLADNFQLESYYAVLASSQSNRFQEIMLQVCGLKMVSSNQKLARTLDIADSQFKKFKDILARYDIELDPLYHRFQRQTIAGLSPGESLESRSSQVRASADSICAIERKREVELGTVLSNAQQEEWRRLKGVSLQIHWDYDDFMDLISS